MHLTFSRNHAERSSSLNLGPRILALLTCLGLAVTGCSGGAPSEEADQVGTPVRTALVNSGPGAAPIATRGKIAAAKEMQLSFKTGGLIAHIRVREGERVQAGQTLAELALDEISAQAAQADALAEKAERDLARAENLYADEVISLEALQNARTQAELARSGQRAARFNLRYSQIVAPRDGVVLRQFLEERELVAPGQPVLSLGADEEGYVVRTALSDRDLVKVALGDTVTIDLDAYPDSQLEGVIQEIAGAADPMTGLFPIEVQIQNPAALRLSSGLVAKLTVQPATVAASPRIYVPIAAVVDGDGRSAHVFLINSGVARKQQVEIDFIVDEQVAVKSGLKSGDAVITEGALYLQDGDPVRVLEDN